MRIEAADFNIELAIKGADGTDHMVEVPASEVFEFCLKSDADAEAARDQKRDTPYSPLAAFKAWLVEKGMPATLSDELFGALLIKIRNQIPAIQKKMLETDTGKPN